MKIVKEQNRSKINIVTRQILQPRSSFHWHENYEICQVVKNTCCFLVNGTIIEAGVGDVITIGENVVHCFLPEREEPYVRIMQFSLKVLLDAGIPIKPLKVHITSGDIKKVPKLEHLINELFDIIEEEGRVACKEENYYQQCMVSALYGLLIRHFAVENTIDSKKEQREFIKIVDYVNGHFEEDINVNILSERLFLSRNRLSSIFTEYSGMNLKEYIYLLRIKKANYLMNQGAGITEAAFQSGFQSIRTFNDVYKKIMGITPSDYRKGIIQ